MPSLGRGLAEHLINSLHHIIFDESCRRCLAHHHTHVAHSVGVDEVHGVAVVAPRRCPIDVLTWRWLVLRLEKWLRSGTRSQMHNTQPLQRCGHGHESDDNPHTGPTSNRIFTTSTHSGSVSRTSASTQVDNVQWSNMCVGFFFLSAKVPQHQPPSVGVDNLVPIDQVQKRKGQDQHKNCRSRKNQTGVLFEIWVPGRALDSCSLGVAAR